MKINNLSLPHPVLGINDDVGKFTYKPNFSVSLGKSDISLLMENLLDNPTLKKLISEKKAMFCTELNCMQTVYRQSFSTYEFNSSITLKADQLRNKVDVSFYIVASEDVDNYQIEGSNEDYQGYKFNIEKGDVLAYGGSTSFVALKDWESLKAVKSFMDIQSYNEDKGPMKITLTESKIIIRLCRDDFDKYSLCLNAEGLPPIFHSSIVLPALIYALNEMISHRDEHEDESWFQILEYRKKNDEKLSIFDWTSPENIPIIAQQILDYPLGRTLTAIETLTKVTDSEE